MTNHSFRALLMRYFGKRRYLLDTARALGVSRGTVANWIHADKPIPAHYYRRLATMHPVILRRRERWANAQIQRIQQWLAAQPAELYTITLELNALHIRALRHGPSARVE